RTLAEQSAVVRLLHRWRRILARTEPFERIAATLDLALDVAGLAARATQIFEAVVMRLELVVSHSPILDSQVGIDEALAGTLLQMGLVDEVGGLKAIRLSVPMHQSAADAGSRQKADPSPHRQRGLIGGVADGHRLLDVVLHQRLADSEAQFVMDGGR